MSLGNTNVVRDINQCRQVVDQMMQECQQFDVLFRQMQQQEAQNVQILEQEARTQSDLLLQMAQRERQAVQSAEIALRANEMSLQRLSQTAQICSQIELTINNMFSNLTSQSFLGQNSAQQIQ